MSPNFDGWEPDMTPLPRGWDDIIECNVCFTLILRSHATLHAEWHRRRTAMAVKLSPGAVVVRGREVMVLNYAGEWLAPGVAVPMPRGPDKSWDVLREGHDG